MNENDAETKYAPMKIPERSSCQSGGDAVASLKPDNKSEISFSDGLFYEIDYETHPIQGVGKFVSKPQKIKPPGKDEIRELFYKMRDIARANRTVMSFYSRSFSRGDQKENAKIFYKQAIFMKDFEDDYPEKIPFTSYFPYYQLLGYEQLRTYFTWRTKVRKNDIGSTSLSYVFLYIYELLNIVGPADPQDGLDKLVNFRNTYLSYDKSIDKYLIRWIKEFHIYYNIPGTFKDFVEKNNLAELYPEMREPDDFALYCAISKYDILKSAYFTDENSVMITECFLFVLNEINKSFEEAGMDFNNALFRPTKKKVRWLPFRDALFHNYTPQPDRTIVLSESEIYICRKNEWATGTVVTTEKGRQFIGYVMKQIESILRKLTKYKYRLTANINMVNPDTIQRLEKSDINIESLVRNAVLEYHKEATKTIVAVELSSLRRIRKEALITQQALTVEEICDSPAYIPTHDIFEEPDEGEIALTSDEWEDLKNVLNEIETQALVTTLKGEAIKAIADSNGIMLEVLADGINEKALDCIGDNILDEDFRIYDDYIEQTKGMVEQQ